MFRWLLTISLLLAPLLPAQELTRALSVALIESLDEEQKKEILLPRDHENRWSMRYTGGGDRPGIPIGRLTDPQSKAALALVSAVLSKKGLAKLDEVQKQDGDFDISRMVLVFFGDPRTDASFGWRLGEHHYTIVQMEVKGETIEEFGPFLLGSNPYGPWDSEERNFIKAFAAAGGAIPVVKGKGIASEAIPAGDGIAITKLPVAAQEALKAAWLERTSLLTEAVGESLEKLVSRTGGWETVRVAAYSQAPEKIGSEGGRWDMKVGNERFVFDIETSRGHNHMSLWVRP